MIGIEKYVSYDPETGKFYWIKKSSRNTILGSEAGFLEKKTGYVRIRFNGKAYMASRVAYYLMSGEVPSLIMDHKDRDRSNNKWENLRMVSRSINNANKTGSRNYYRKSSSGKFQAMIKVNGIRKHLGMFSSEEDAKEAVLRERLENNNGFQLG